MVYSASAISRPCTHPLSASPLHSPLVSLSLALTPCQPLPCTRLLSASPLHSPLVSLSLALAPVCQSASPFYSPQSTLSCTRLSCQSVSSCTCLSCQSVSSCTRLSVSLSLALDSVSCPLHSLAFASQSALPCVVLAVNSLADSPPMSCQPYTRLVSSPLHSRPSFLVLGLDSQSALPCTPSFSALLKHSSERRNALVVTRGSQANALTSTWRERGTHHACGIYGER
jgi:hypothetical protein